MTEADVIALLVDADPGTPLVQRVCEVSVDLLGVTGAGMCLIGGRQQQIIVHGTDAVAEQLEDLQVELREGPCVHAVRVGSPVLVPRLEDHRASSWSRYAHIAVSLGVRALFSFPLHAGPTQIGALDLHRMTPGALTDSQTRTALLLTQVATHAMLAQEDQVHLDGTVSALHWLRAQHRTDTADISGATVDRGLTVADDDPAPPGTGTAERETRPGPQPGLGPTTHPRRPVDHR